MNIFNRSVIVVICLAASTVARAEVKTLRAAEMSATSWSDFTQGKLDGFVVEFREGDELPVSIEAKGDLIETKRDSKTYINVKRNFWIRLKKKDIELSLDGETFKSLSQVVSGTAAIGAGSSENGGIANALDIVLQVNLK